MAADSFKTKVMAAIGWSAAMKLAFQVVSWALTLLVIRILSPRDYGLQAMAQVFTTFMLGFANLGLGDALVQREDASRHVVASAFGLLLCMSVALMLLLCAAAYPIAGWYGDARLVPLVQVSSLGFIFNALTTLPRMALSKSLSVRPLFLAEFLSGLVGAVTVIALAWTGHGVWSLMLGWLAGNVAKLAAFAVLTPDFFLRPQLDLAAVRPLLGYGAYSTAEYVAWSVMTSADVLIVGRVLGAVDLGLYAVVLNFAAMPVNKIAPIVNAVAFPAFAMVQGRLADARFYVLKALKLMSVMAVPVFLGIGVTAPEIVDLVFGPKWAAARPLLAILSVALTFRALLILIPNYLQGIGDAKAAFWCTGVGAVVFPVAVLIGCHWGIAGVCTAWLAAYPAVFAAEALIASWRGSMSFLSIVAAPARPFIAGAAMVAAVAATRPFLPAAWPEAAHLAALAGVGGIVYVTIVTVGFPALAAEFRGLLSRRQPA